MLSGQSLIPVLRDAPGQAYSLPDESGEGWLHIHVYPNSDAAIAKENQVGAAVTKSIADWAGRPHAFRCDNLIVLYLGQEKQVVDALTELCDPPFVQREP